MFSPAFIFRAAEEEAALAERAQAELVSQSSGSSTPARDGSKLSCVRFLTKKSKDAVSSELSGDGQNERKFSGDHSKLMPSLRMKASFLDHNLH